MPKPTADEVFRTGYYWYQWARESAPEVITELRMAGNPVPDEPAKYDFTEADVGLYIDAAFGMDHALGVMAGLVEGRDPELAKELQSAANRWRHGKYVEFAHEMLDEGTDLLQAYTAPGLVWWWEAGDFGLSPEADLQW